MAGAVRRHAASGEPVGTFCRREGVSTHSYRRWKLRLGGQATTMPRAAKKLQQESSVTAVPFVDLGAIASAPS